MPGVWVYPAGATAQLPVTRWRIVRIPEWPKGSSPWSPGVLLIVDTTAPAVLEAIERAAERYGIELERVEEEE